MLNSKIVNYLSITIFKFKQIIPDTTKDLDSIQIADDSSTDAPAE